jgi:hypothetical protein
MIMVAVLATLITTAQVTTSSITGVVKTADGQPIEGASLVAVHTPSGTQYSTLAKKGGVFHLTWIKNRWTLHFKNHFHWIEGRNSK